MNPAQRQLLTDVKAAARIGHPASLQAALDGLLQFPEVSANSPLGEEFIQQVILPLGSILAASRIDDAVFQPYQKSASACMRAIAAVICAVRFSEGQKGQRVLIDRSAADSRSDVRRALALALQPFAETSPSALAALLDDWLGSQSPRLQQAALMVFPFLPSSLPGWRLAKFEKLQTSSDPDLRLALADALTLIAENGRPSDVIALLQAWSQAGSPNSWVITRTLSASWAAADPAASLAILHTLALSAVEPRHLATALKALARHGAGQAVRGELSRWRSENDPALPSLAARLDSQLSAES